MDASSSTSISVHHGEDGDIVMASQSQADGDHKQRSRKRRKSRRLTLPKKKTRWVFVSDGTITPAAFHKLPELRLVKVPIRNQENGSLLRCVFAVGDNILVNSVDDETENEWICKILDIRVEAKQNRVWINVAWYYSAKDIVQSIDDFYVGKGKKPSANVEHDYIRNNILKQTTPDERFLSNDTKILLVDVIRAFDTVYPYEEGYVGSPEFGPQQSYTRRVFDIESRTVIPPLSTSLCGICQEHAYLPFPVSEDNMSSSHSDSGYSASSTATIPYDPWHFCPRLGCQRWYHRSCLVSQSPDNRANLIGPPNILRFAVNPYSPAPHPVLNPFTFPKPPRGKFSASGSMDGINPWDAVLEKLKSLPPGLVRVAQQPITKVPGLDPERSVMGNLKDVFIARKICYQELDGGIIGDELDDYLVEVGLILEDEDINMEGQGKGKQKTVSGKDGAKILACPYRPYWDKHYPNIPPDEEHPNVMCPACQAAI